MKKIIKILALILCIAMIVTALVSLVSCGDNHGDGVSTCKNCKKKSIYKNGFCRRCYESFYKYTYGHEYK